MQGLFQYISCPHAHALSIPAFAIDRYIALPASLLGARSQHGMSCCSSADFVSYRYPEELSLDSTGTVPSTKALFLLSRMTICLCGVSRTRGGWHGPRRTGGDYMYRLNKTFSGFEVVEPNLYRFRLILSHFVLFRLGFLLFEHRHSRSTRSPPTTEGGECRNINMRGRGEGGGSMSAVVVRPSTLPRIV